ncbi:hypothetical protein [Myceligenerans xiligouense]|uniref:hypothetical protein n=1 Tax=Myceligenerans xiligouense TaxID=253184 RepID=UPI0014772B4A|nr:hypothetical protein [Myceligenerans xiligouense]
MRLSSLGRGRASPSLDAVTTRGAPPVGVGARAWPVCATLVESAEYPIEET